jgi:hypothetical protein
MNREGHENTEYFIGPEVEQTPAYSKRTLFVVGLRDPDEVEQIARQNRCPHIFLGANQSFDYDALDDSEKRDWDRLVTHFLDMGFWVTLDYQAHQHKDVLNMLNPGIWQCRTFVPMLSVRIPKVLTSSHNLTIKIDDIDYKATNPGVWCMSFREVTDSNRFTEWQEYNDDEPVHPYDTYVPVEKKAPKVELKPAPPPRVPEVSEVKNDGDLGLDTTSASMLKPESAEELLETKLKVATPQDAAEIYADSVASHETKDTAKKPAPKAKK